MKVLLIISLFILGSVFNIIARVREEKVFLVFFHRGMYGKIALGIWLMLLILVNIIP
jgi:hypothetical protein